MNSSRALALLCAWKGSFPGLRRRQPAQRVPPTGVLKHPCPGGLPCHLRTQRSSTAPRSSTCGTRGHCDMSRSALDLGSQNEPFRGVQVVFPITRNICVRKASNLYVSSAKSARARNSKSEGFFCRIVRCALRGPSQVEGRSSSRASGWLFGERAKKPHRSETAFIRPFDCATFL